MIILFLVIGIMLLVSALKGTETELARQIEGDLTGVSGKSGFIVWLVAIIAVGALGYIPYLERPSKYLTGLIILVIVLSNKGVFAQLFNAIPAFESQGPSASVPLPVPQSGSSGSGGSQQSSSGGGGSSTLQTVAEVAAIAAIL